MSNEESANELAKGLADVMEVMQPMFETAKGIKAAMEKDGWSPTAAETAASAWLNGAIGMMWRSQS